MECPSMLLTNLDLLGDLSKRVTLACHSAKCDSVIAYRTFFSDHFLLALLLAFFMPGDFFVLFASGCFFVLFWVGNRLVFFFLRIMRNISIISSSGSMLSASSIMPSASR